MPTVACIACKTKFRAKPSWIKAGNGKYCSRNCFFKKQRNGKLFSCSTCGKKTYKNNKAIRRSMSGKFFCTKSCQTKWRNVEFSGKNHGNWQGGETVYRKILRQSGIDQICKKCSTHDKRVLAVHHKDKNRKNNDVSNLLWLCHNCHYLVHHFDNESNGFVVPVAQ